MASEQRDLRFFIQELKPSATPFEGAALGVRLRELAQRMEREWDLRVDLSLATHEPELPPPLCRDIYHIVREALVNAARHGAASEARVAIAPAVGDAVALSIADNGRGFSFTGCYSADELADLNLGPKTLRERVSALQGSLTLESGPGGAELSVVLPLHEAA
jgi:signal transduction histidine kinase